MRGSVRLLRRPRPGPRWMKLAAVRMSRTQHLLFLPPRLLTPLLLIRSWWRRFQSVGWEEEEERDHQPVTRPPKLTLLHENFKISCQSKKVGRFESGVRVTCAHAHKLWVWSVEFSKPVERDDKERERKRFHCEDTAQLTRSGVPAEES